jgi:glutaminyl-peptide cyclotransferase
LNELEWVKGQIYANVWQTNVVVLINPDSGAVTGIIDFSRLLGPPKHPGEHPGELNGIAYDARRDRLFVTGKNWPTLFEVRLQTRSRLSSGMR